ncbi:MAG: hypothetical protein AB1465_03245 [Patescibacteria group bacterium]
MVNPEVRSDRETKKVEHCEDKKYRKRYFRKIKDKVSRRKIKEKGFYK